MLPLFEPPTVVMLLLFDAVLVSVIVPVLLNFSVAVIEPLLSYVPDIFTTLSVIEWLFSPSISTVVVPEPS